MKFTRSILAGALAFALSSSIALAQTNPGSSPLPGGKGGTGNAFMQFTGPATSMKTFTLPNASDTIATLTGSQTLTNKTFNCANNACTVRIASDVTGLGTGCVTFLVTPTSANLRGCLTDEVGTGAFYTVGGALGTPASGSAANLTGLPVSGLAAQAAYTFIGNNSGSSAIPTAVDIASLTTKGSPASGDYILLSDQAASGAWKKASVSSLASAGSVASIDGATGAFTISGLLARSSQDLRVVAATQSDQETGTITTVAVVPNTQQFHSSAAKAWIYGSGSGSWSTLASYNMTGSRSTTGTYSFDFGTDFSSANYACVSNASTTGKVQFTQQGDVTHTGATMNLKVYEAPSFTAADASAISVICFGDQ